jgi:hypothetical protein
MSRHALRGIGQVIKANTTEKSIETLQAEGKKRVRVVSSDRVMAIIQAIVDDTINAEVGAITSRDRERIVNDTQERFSRVLKMQQDLEQQVDDLRGSLRTAEIERERLRADKALLEAQCEAARRVENDADAVARMSRELARLRESVERTARDGSAVDEASLTRLAEKLAARDAQTSRRVVAEFDDLRTRLDAVGRDAAAARESTTDRLLERIAEQQAQAETKLAQRLEREFRSVAVCLAQIHEEAARAPAAVDALAKLRSDFDALEGRILGVERGSSETAERVSRAVLELLEEREAAADSRRGAAAGLDAAQWIEALRRLHHSSETARQNVLDELAGLRATVEDARKHASSVGAEQFSDLERRVAESHDEVVRAVERAASNAKPEAEIESAVASLHGEIAALAARTAESAARQDAAVQALREHLAQNAAVQSDALASSFKGALEKALDKITKTMEAATARPIETTVEATDVLLAKIFDAPDVEISSNLDELDVEQRRSHRSILTSVDRLKQMSGANAAGTDRPA